MLRVAAYTEFYPVCYIADGDQICGSDIQIIKRFAESRELSVEFVEQKEFDGIWNLPAKGFDIAIGGIANSRARINPSVFWSIPYKNIRRSILFNKNCPIKKFPEDFRTIVGVIHSTSSSTGWLDAQEKIKKAKLDLKILKHSNNDLQDIRDLLDGKIAGLIRGDFVSKAWCDKYPQLSYLSWEISSEIMCDESFSFPCCSEELVMQLSKFIKKEIER